jgi:hypothetical protein
MGQWMSSAYDLVDTTFLYWRGIYHYSLGAGRSLPYDYYLQNEQSFVIDRQLTRASAWSNAQHARIHLFSLASHFYTWRRPHYRKPTYQQDLLDNLSNVYIPGTQRFFGPLSLFVYSRFRFTILILIVNPVASLIASLHYSYKMKRLSESSSSQKSCLVTEYQRRLLSPNDWFNYWRLNCNVVALHSLFNSDIGGSCSKKPDPLPLPEAVSKKQQQVAKDYSMENKWTFLQFGDAVGVPISPFMKEPACLVVKHKNEEGGLGIHFFRNAANADSGDWIIQAKMDNSAWVASLLPENAPLSTFRVITCSYHALLDPSSGEDANTSADDHATIVPLSCVFRAGRQHAATDHDSILFNVDMNTGTIGGGTTNAHWYKHKPKPGDPKRVRYPWRSWEHDRVSVHPDDPTKVVSGQVIPDFHTMVLPTVQDAHARMCPHVPFCGWDVVLTNDPQHPICLLEVRPKGFAWNQLVASHASAASVLDYMSRLGMLLLIV